MTATTAEREERLPDIQSYTGRDFSTILQELEEWIVLNKPELWSDFFESNLGKFLIDLIAYHGDLLSFAIDRVSEEVFLPTCRQYKSGLKHAQLLAYKPYAATAASVDVRVSPLPDGIVTHGVTVAQGEQIRVSSGLVFEVSRNYSFPAGSTEMEINLVEGETVEEEFISSGADFITITTENTKIIDGSWVVSVNTVEWTEVEFVELTPYAGEVYSVQFEGDRSITVRFGDGLTGAVPPAGATITINMRVGGGAAGNVPSNTIATSLPALMNGESIALNVVNDFAASGGADRETLEHIKRWAPLNVKTVDKAITREDYEIESGSFADATYGAIARASAKLRIGTLAIPDPGPADYTIIEEFTTVDEHTELQSLGNKAGTYVSRVAFSFTIPADNLVSRLSFYTKKLQLPGNVSLRVETDDAGKPSGTLVDPYGWADISEASIYGTGWIRVRLQSQIQLYTATTYWCVLELGSDPEDGAYYEVYGSDTDDYANGKYAYFPMNLVDAQTVLLLHCNGNEDATVFPDSSTFAATVTSHGNVKVSQFNPVFGNGAASFDGAMSYLSTPDSANLTWTGDFTAEAWVQFSGIFGQQFIMAHGDDSASVFSVLRDHANLRWEVRVGGDTFYFPSIVAPGVWYHLELSRASGNLRCFQMGVQVGSTESSTDTVDCGSSGFFFGASYAMVNFHIGKLDEIRLTKDLARHTSNFPVETREYGGMWVDGTEIVDAAFRVEIGGPHVVHADDPITFDGIVYKAKSEFTITGNNMAIFIDPNTVDVYVWAITLDSELRRTYGQVSSGLKAALLAHLDARAVVCTISFVHDGGLVPIDLNLGDVYVDRTYELAVVEAAIYDAVEAFFMSEDIGPGTSFLLSDFYNEIEDVPGVLHFVERMHYGDVGVSDTEMIVRGNIQFTVVHPQIDIIRDITARY